MPYSEYAVKDRAAVSQLRYQIKRFNEQMVKAGAAEEDRVKIKSLLSSALSAAESTVDFDDDGTRLPVTQGSSITMGGTV
jgi:hypothetical protein